MQTTTLREMIRRQEEEIVRSVLGSGGAGGQFEGGWCGQTARPRGERQDDVSCCMSHVAACAVPYRPAALPVVCV